MPNTKTKKFDFQVFLAVLLILLVICCATVCVVLSNNENGVAHAAGAEVVTNLQFSVSDGFYVNKLTSTEFEKIFEYFTPYTSGDNFSITSISGYFHMNYNGSQTSKDVYFYLNIGKVTFGSQVLRQFEVLLDNFTDEQLFMYSFVGEQSEFQSSYTYIDNAGDYFFNIVGSTSSSGTFANQLVNIFGLTNVNSIDSLDFTFYNTSNLGCLISPNHTFASIPVFGAGNVEELQAEINRLNGIIESKDNTIDYYEALMPQTETVAVFDISKCVPSTFVYNGVTYSSDTIKPIEGGGWNVYDSRYIDKQLPTNQSVGFSLLLTETLNNTKIHINPNIQPWYHYTYCSEPNEQGESQCFDHLVKHLSFSVGYRNQNGQVVKLGEVSPDLVGNTEFIINQPTNEIVFFALECNRLEIGKGMGVFYYKVNTQVLYDEAYAEGYKTGYGYGKYVGKNEGIEQASDYSFFSLFSAVFDAPITAIVGRWGDSDGDGVYEREGGMLNFYIPGLEINFAPFLLSMFTIAIIVMIIRFILARKS